jgi:hypothetical protein
MNRIDLPPAGQITGDSHRALMPPEDIDHDRPAPTWHQSDPHQRQYIGIRYVEYSPGNGTPYRCIVQWLHPDISARLGGRVLVSVAGHSASFAWASVTMQDAGFLHSTYLEEKFRSLTQRSADWPWIAWLIAYALDRDTDVDADWLRERLQGTSGARLLPAAART